MAWLYSIFLAGLALSSSPHDRMPAVQNASPAAYARAEETEHFDQTYPLTPNGRVSLSNVNGGITVEAWDRNEVRLEYTKIADSRERLSQVNVRIDARPDAITVQADYDNWKSDKDRSWKLGGKLEVEFHLMVPHGAMLDEIETVNGSIGVSNFTNFTKVSAVNGTVKASNIRGTAKFSTVNGEVEADFDRLESGSKISLETVNGRVNLSIPSDSNATLKADSLNGSITNDFNLPVRKGKYVGRDLFGRLGTGDVHIKLSSVNGGLTVIRKNDGRALSPSTNLLTEKGRDDDDWDGDLNVDPSVPQHGKIDKLKLDKDIQKSVRPSERAADAAAADLSADLARVGPEIERGVGEAARVNSAEMQKTIRDAIRQQAQLERAVDAVFLPGVPKVDTKGDTFTVHGVPLVTIEGADCSVKVTGWDRSEVQYRVVRISPGRLALPLNVTDGHTDSSVNIKVEGTPKPAQRFRDGGVTIEVFVPRRSNINVHVGGEVRLEGVSGRLDLDAADSSVNVRDASGSLRVAANDGRVRVIGFNGDAEIAAGDSQVSLEGDFSSLRATAGEAPINLTFPAGFSAELFSNAPSVESDGLSLTRLAPAGERSTYRIGQGGKRQLFVDTGGSLLVRSPASIEQAN